MNEDHKEPFEGNPIIIYSSWKTASDRRCWKRKSYYNISKGTKFQDYCIDYLYSIGKC